MNANPIKKTIYKDVFGDFILDSKDKIKENLALIDIAMNTNNLDTLTALYKNGPLCSGDLPSKSERDWLVENGFSQMIIVKGSDGFNACTHKGAWLHRCIESLYRRFSQDQP